MAAKILELREQGLSYKQIQDELGCSKGTIAYHLGEGQKLKYADNSRRARERRYAKYYALKDLPCEDCGKKYLPPMMHWDHMGEEEKDAHLSWMVNNAAWQTVLDEIAKCELVCGNCHTMRTIKRSIQGGTASQLLIDYYNNYIEDNRV